jgi:hypothetical protein
MKKAEQPDNQYLYNRVQEFKLELPLQFWLLCKILQIPPAKIIIEFMKNVGREHDALREDIKHVAMIYILDCEYGQKLYTREDIHQMLLELDAIAALWPGMGNSKHIEKHVQLRDKFHEAWEKKWKNKLLQKQ